jgi:hypothetical protein
VKKRLCDDKRAEVRRLRAGLRSEMLFELVRIGGELLKRGNQVKAWTRKHKCFESACLPALLPSSPAVQRKWDRVRHGADSQCFAWQRELLEPGWTVFFVSGCLK